MTQDLDAEIEVGGHPADDRELLVVLLTEDGHVGPSRGQELGHHGRDAVEVTRTRGPLHLLGEFGDVHRGGEARRVHRRRSGSEDQVDAGVVAGPQVVVEGARVVVVVTLLAELERVDEDRDDHPIGVGGGGGDQFEMAAVQRPHRGDERDPLAGRAGRTGPLASGGRGVDDGGHAPNATAPFAIGRRRVERPMGRRRDRRRCRRSSSPR